MPVTINGNGTITGVSVGGLPDGIVDTDMLANGAVTAAKRGAGAILQVVQDTKTDAFSTTSASDVEVSGLSVSITPSSASNKVLISVNLGQVGGYTDCYAGFTLFRTIGGTSTDLLIGDVGGGNRPSVTFVGVTDNISSYGTYSASFEFLDSPNTTSEITYKIKVRSGYTNYTVNVNRMNLNDNANYTFRCASTYIAKEIAA